MNEGSKRLLEEKTTHEELTANSPFEYCRRRWPPGRTISGCDAPMKLAIILLIMISKTFSLWCVDGNDCDATCSFCEGAACLRVQRQHPTRGVTTAMTCLPHDSLVHAYHPEGCRTELATGENSNPANSSELVEQDDLPLSLTYDQRREDDLL
ncbi:hypothetical protein RB195_026474 [Necator americanus]|uniref:Uncharacterized protein n=1 Tax=Necator americanus TaxID=51031 RepID=A0ABR1EX26_NECAM